MTIFPAAEARMTGASDKPSHRRLFLRVAAIAEEAAGIRSYELVSLDGAALPRFAAGAHIGISVPLVGSRHYSLSNPPWETHRYVIGIQREENGRGGSRALHSRMRVGAILKATPPRNDFPLAQVGEHVLIAGGIGITPMLAMSYELLRRAQPFHLWMCARAPGRTPFRGRLERLAEAGYATLHYSAGQARLDLDAAIGSPLPDRHLYCCGPSGLVRAVAKVAMGWPASNRHFESFTPTDGFGTDHPFSVTIRSTGQVVDVTGSETLLDALRREGIGVDSSCEAGSCGTCRVAYSAGRPLHRDIALTAQEQQHQLLACVSRAEGSDMVLDL